MLAFVTIFAFSNIASASGNITGKAFWTDGNYTGVTWGPTDRNSITRAMEAPNGILYINFLAKAVAFVNADIYSSVDRVRLTPSYSTGDLRIDPNYTSNWVGPNQKNSERPVKGVQTVLFDLGYITLDDFPSAPYGIDGICGS